MISIFDLFTVGVGPSSSHTVGTMRAANAFLKSLLPKLPQVFRLKVTLYGSLAYTGRGHGTDKSIVMGLTGVVPKIAQPDVIESTFQKVKETNQLFLMNQYPISFDLKADLVFNMTQVIEYHPNAVRFVALGKADEVLCSRLFYSIGGGFIIDDANSMTSPDDRLQDCPYPFKTSEELLHLCRRYHLSIADLTLKNEQAKKSSRSIKQQLFDIVEVMKVCIERGCKTEGVLPGSLVIVRRAPHLYNKLKAYGPIKPNHPKALNWLNTYAIAVGEENAAGGRVVTAPTNGAAGILPAVLHYYKRFIEGANDKGVINFLATAGAIGILYKQNASISGAELGCQAEIGVACSMAAAGLTSALGGTVEQVEHAAEVAMEHNLGLTCDPVAGLVQIPCIERNAMGASTAVNAANLVLMEQGIHRVSLDTVIQTMLEVGQHMDPIYKETAQGGLATKFCFKSGVVQIPYK